MLPRAALALSPADAQLRALHAQYPGSQEAPVAQILHRSGGGHFTVPRAEPVMPWLGEDLLMSGAHFWDAPVRLLPMQDNFCHANAGTLHLERGWKVATGYALNEEENGVGLWRRHSWAVDGHGQIVETTERDAYYGFVLDNVNAEAFALYHSTQGGTP